VCRERAEMCDLAGRVAMTIWLISDTHFGHANILTFYGPVGPDNMAHRIRPEFQTSDEMDETMIERWNEVVRPNDHVYHLGDVAMARRFVETVTPRLNGHKRLVRGNHDIYKTAAYLKAGWKEIHGMRVIDNIVLTHAPIHPQCLGRFTGNVHGHIHANASPPGRYLNVCVERIGYRPVSLEVAKAQLLLEHEVATR
jgi:calcineurin-like phosphoesterase family protein